MEDEFDNFFIEDIERYKLTVFVNGKSYADNSNNLEQLVNTYNEIIRDNLTNDNHIVLSIYDYNKDTNIYYYDSEEERC